METTSCCVGLKRHMAPGEMVMVEVTREELASCGTLRIEVEG